MMNFNFKIIERTITFRFDFDISDIYRLNEFVFIPAMASINRKITVLIVDQFSSFIRKFLKKIYIYNMIINDCF
ncbi:MAG: hypothetical protein CMJ42_21690 [Phyllobacteriaceae bacterium]|nr:hypothetical protein [Phyllobacteriaceae bacterium]MBA93151.1 hypothetical protein [Phyllobacteriaceae bacterium]